MDSAVERIKERLSVKEVVEGHMKLEKAGVNWRALCPFHTEKTPSFFVSPARNSFYCFGCGAKGDIFTFVERMEGVDFRGALEILAARAGVTLEMENRGASARRERLYKTLEAAARLFEEGLSRHQGVDSYLSARGVAKETAHIWRIGYAPSGWRNLLIALKETFSEKDLLDAGLIKYPDAGEESAAEGGEKHPYDRFRNRIMFPIADSSGRIVAFSGRICEEAGGPKAPAGSGRTAEAKYLNSPETPVFRKSKILHGFDKAKGAIRKFNFAIMVEGQFDLIMAHQGGFPNTVALSGTALSEEHLAQLSRLSTNLLLALDPDPAGIASAGRSAHMALAHGFDVKVAALPEGFDPADLIRKDPLAFKKAVREGKHVVDFFLDHLLATISDKRKLGKEVEAVVVPYLRAIKSKIDQAHFIKKVAAALGIEESIIKELAAQSDQSGRVSAPRPLLAERPTEKKALLERHIAGIILAGHAHAGQEERFFELCGDPHILERYRVSGAAEKARASEKPDDTIKQLEELLLHYEEEVVREDLSLVTKGLEEAEREGNDDLIKSLLAKGEQLGKKLLRLQSLIAQ